jgi:hypothetical protein
VKSRYERAEAHERAVRKQLDAAEAEAQLKRQHCEEQTNALAAKTRASLQSVRDVANASVEEQRAVCCHRSRACSPAPSSPPPPSPPPPPPPSRYLTNKSPVCAVALGLWMCGLQRVDQVRAQITEQRAHAQAELKRATARLEEARTIASAALDDCSRAQQTYDIRCGELKVTELCASEHYESTLAERKAKQSDLNRAAAELGLTLDNEPPAADTKELSDREINRRSGGSGSGSGSGSGGLHLLLTVADRVHGLTDLHVHGARFAGAVAETFARAPQHFQGSRATMIEAGDEHTAWAGAVDRQAIARIAQGSPLLLARWLGLLSRLYELPAFMAYARRARRMAVSVRRLTSCVAAVSETRRKAAVVTALLGITEPLHLDIVLDELSARMAPSRDPPVSVRPVAVACAHCVP